MHIVRGRVVLMLLINVCMFILPHGVVCAILISKALRLAHVSEGSHSITCHPRVYPGENAKHEIAGHQIDGPICQGGNCRAWKLQTGLNIYFAHQVQLQ